MTKAKFKVKKGDEVIVIAGREKGKKGKITQVITESSRVVVEGVNKVKRHQKPSKLSGGGIVEKEMSLHVSNVMLLDPKSGKGTRVGYKIEGERKLRIARSSGAPIL